MRWRWTVELGDLRACGAYKRRGRRFPARTRPTGKHIHRRRRREAMATVVRLVACQKTTPWTTLHPTTQQPNNLTFTKHLHLISPTSSPPPAGDSCRRRRSLNLVSPFNFIAPLYQEGPFKSGQLRIRLGRDLQRLSSEANVGDGPLLRSHRDARRCAV